MRKTLSTVFALLFMLSMLSSVLLSCQSEELESCSETEEATDISDSSDTSQSLFSAEEMSDTEIEIMEKITRRKIGDITENDLRAVKTINIIGSNISLSPYYMSFSKDVYAYNNTLFPYGDDIGSSLSVLKNFTGLRVLGIYFCESLDDVSFLESLTELEELRIIMSSVEDLSVVQKLEKLTRLEIKCSPVDTIAFSDSNNLQYLYISNSNISSLAPFRRLKNLNTFSLIFNRTEVTETDVLCDMSSLNTLDLIAPDFDLSFIGKMNAPALTNIILGGHDSIDLRQVSSVFPQLKTFRLKHSDNTDLTPLDALPEECSIEVAFSENCIHGTRTTDGAPKYEYSDISHDIFDWYYEN